MHSLRRHRWIALLLALWMSATVAAAALAPLIKKTAPGDLAVLCTSVGMKLVSLNNSGEPVDLNMGKAHSGLDCPGCLAQLVSAPPPTVISPVVIRAEQTAATEPSAFFTSREALTASARGPPSRV